MGTNYFQVLVMGGGVIGYLLWAISVATVAIVVQYFISIRRSNILPESIRDQVRSLFENRQYRDAIEVTANDPSFLSYVINAALGQAANGYPAMERAMAEAVEERTVQLLRRIEWLNLIGNVSPMLGLLGTVWGMIRAFFDIVRAGGVPEPRVLAGSIGIALVTTLLGLGVAIPALSVYAVMRNRIDALSGEALATSEELVVTFRPGKKPAATAPEAG